MTKKVYIMRGLPGSGKSTFIRKNLKDAFVCSADHFFEQHDGSYKFNPALLGEAHAECMRRFVFAVTDGHSDCIVVDNTNTSLNEVLPYVRIAQAFGREVEVVSLQVDAETAFNRNVHGVPLKNIKNMARRFEKFFLPSNLNVNHRVVDSVEMS